MTTAGWQQRSYAAIRMAKNAPSELDALMKPLSVPEAQARPVTLGIVLVLGGVLVAMLSYVFSEVRELNKEFGRFQLEQTKANGSLDKRLAEVQHSCEVHSAVADVVVHPNRAGAAEQ